MNITKLAIKNSKATLVLIGFLTLLGGMALKSIPQAYDPGFTIRAARIVTTFNGASPERVEQLVTDPIEKALQALPELDFIKSQSKTGVSIITVNIKDSYKEMRPVWDKLRRKIDDIARELPQGVSVPIVND